MRIEKIQGLTVNNIKATAVRAQEIYTAPTMTGIPSQKRIKPGLFQKLKNFINSKLSQKNQNYVKEVKTNIVNILPVTRPIEVKTQKDALKMFVKDEAFSKKVEVKNSKDGSTEIFQRMFDPVSHETRINADYYDIKGKLHHTTVYDHNGLKLSQYFVKFNNPKDPILIRRKDFNVNGKITREEIKYKNGDISYVDYDYFYETQTFKNVSNDGSYEIIKNSKYSTEVWKYDKNGKQTDYKLQDTVLNPAGQH